MIFIKKIAPSPIQLRFAIPASPIYSHWAPTGELFAIRYEAVPLTIEQPYDRILLLNAKDERASLIDTHVDLSEKTCSIYDCMGHLVKEFYLGHDRIIALPIPVSGMAVIS